MRNFTSSQNSDTYLNFMELLCTKLRHNNYVTIMYNYVQNWDITLH